MEICGPSIEAHRQSAQWYEVVPVMGLESPVEKWEAVPQREADKKHPMRKRTGTHKIVHILQWREASLRRGGEGGKKDTRGTHRG